MAAKPTPSGVDCQNLSPDRADTVLWAAYRLILTWPTRPEVGVSKIDIPKGEGQHEPWGKDELG